MPEGRGDELLLSFRDTEVVIARTGATWRALSVGGVDLLWRSAPGELVADGRGQVLAPFPNRLGDGTFHFRGLDVAVPLNEPARANAIHGLVRYLRFDLVSLRPAGAVLRGSLEPQPAWPWGLELDVAYELADDGCAVTWSARSRSSKPAPFGIGFHPYLECGPGGVDAARLVSGARGWLRCDERGLPVREERLADGPLARLSGGEETLGGLVLDDCLTDLDRDPHGVAHVALHRADGVVVEVEADRTHRCLMVYSGDTLSPEHARRALALEPMTCPPDALRTGRDLLTLEPGERLAGRFAIRRVA